MSRKVVPRRRARVQFAGSGIVVGRIEDEPRLWYGMKDRHGFVVPERGTWEFLYRGSIYRQAPGTLQLKQPGEIYRDLRRDGPATYRVVLFDPAVVEAALVSSKTAALVFDTPQLAGSDPRASVLRRLGQLTDRDPPGLSVDVAVAEAALALVSLGGSPAPGGHERGPVRRARNYLLERLSESVRLDEVADHVGLDKYHLIRAFRGQVGASPYEFLTHARVHRARVLLRRGVTASAAATTVGFYDQSQLHRHFVRLVGVTPARYAAASRSSLRGSMTHAKPAGPRSGRDASLRSPDDRAAARHR